jgi:O-methyltransferase involved in polyketide biosynthesis
VAELESSAVRVALWRALHVEVDPPQVAAEGARRSGTPWVSFHRPEEILALAQEAGFRETTHVTAEEVTDRYFARRIQGLRSPSGEDFLLART